MNLDEYASHDGLGLAALVRRGEVTPRELAEIAIVAIDRVNPALNAVIETYRDAPAKAASASDRTNAPFYGVPFLLKDIGSHDAGVTFELGSRLAAGLKAPPFASELVNRFRASGVTIMGRTNVPELGSSCTTEGVLYGATHNPWNLARSPGGSSGGAAAAVISGMVPIAHANDAGGSIRLPASCCGIFGLKPSRNLNPVGPDEAAPVNGFAAEHIVSRTVRDTAAMLDVTAGPDSGAWCYTPRLAGSYLQETMKPVGRLRIGLNLVANFPAAEVSEDVISAIQATAKLCAALGHEIEEASLDFHPEPALRANYILWASGLRSGIIGLSQVTGRQPGQDTLEPHILAAYHAADTMTATDVQWALGHLNALSRSYGRYFETYDVMLSPVGASEPFELGRIPAIPASNFWDWYMAMSAHSPFTASVNMAGVPAMSVPLGTGATGLTVGSHFVAGIGQEALLLRLAAQLEAAKPWFGLRPPTHVSRGN